MDHINPYSIKADTIASAEYLEILARRILMGQEILIEETAQVLTEIAAYVRALEASRLPATATSSIISE